MIPVEKAFEDQLIGMVRTSPELIALLKAVRRLGLASWCIGAGVVRSLVWDRLHGFTAPSHYNDVDVVYYDDQAGSEQDEVLQERLQAYMPSVRWEVTNQAWIHHWFLTQHSQVVSPLRSLAEGGAQLGRNTRPVLALN